MINKEQLFEKILPFVTKPVRYIGNEFNSAVKPAGFLGVKVALAFPEIYEVGMSFLGYKILYEIVNRRDDALAERVFLPWVDMAQKLRENNIPLYTLETFTPVKEFDILGITLQYEMTYSNVLELLDLSGIPVFAKDRGEKGPLVIGGGPSAYNPEPMADFFDCFAIGEGEEVINEIIGAVKENKKSGKEKKELLKILSGIKGVYVPSLYETLYNEDGTVKKITAKEGAPEKIEKRIVKNLDGAFFPSKFVVPFMNVVQDRVNIEIRRGCTRGCRFCVSGMTTRPVRERSVNNILGLGCELLNNTGYDEISLLSLSTTDHTGISGLVKCLDEKIRGRSVSIAIPSSRIDAFSLELAGSLSSVRKSTLTFAVEAATERLRNVINKSISEEDLLKTAEIAFTNGWQGIKLYFMLGLPTETEGDIAAIYELYKKINALGRRTAKRFNGITLSVSFFVPKPHTPFCFEPEESFDSMKNKINMLTSRINPKAIKWHSIELSFLEGVLARGDRLLGPVIYEAWKNGSKFDGWNELFKPEYWTEAFKKCGIDPLFYAARKRDYSEIFPWEHIDAGVTKEFLISENEKAKKGEISGDCRNKECLNCGIERFADCGSPVKNVPAGFTDDIKKDAAVKNRVIDIISKFRVKYGKGAAVRFLSHLDTVNTIHKILLRTGLPLVFSSGFNPHLKTTFSPALSVGINSDSEYFDFEIYGGLSADNALTLLKKQSPNGIDILEVKAIFAGDKLNPSRAVYLVEGLSASAEGHAKVEYIDVEKTAGGAVTISINLDKSTVSNVFKVLEKIFGISPDDVKILKITRIALER